MINSQKQKRVLAYLAELSGELNGHPVDVHGFGTLWEKEGLVSGTYEIGSFPARVSPRFLKTCLVTGYPNCTKDAEVRNPFKGVSEYTYERKIYVADQADVSLRTTVSITDDRLTSKFRIYGNVEPGLTIPENSAFEECWEDNECGLRGAFGFQCGDARLEAISTYFLRPPESIGRNIRSLELSAVVERNCLLLLQRSRYSSPLRNNINVSDSRS